MRTITLNAPGLSFSAGQYLQVLHPDGTTIPLSIASAPNQLPQLRLLYRSDNSATAQAFDQLLKSATVLTIDGPHGRVTADLLTNRPVRIIAAGTGIAQALSLVEHLHHSEHSERAAEVIWSTRFALPETNQLLAPTAWLAVNYCTSSELQQTVLASVSRQPTALNIITGTPDFVYRVQDLLLQAGVAQDDSAADAFDYAPRR